MARYQLDQLGWHQFEHLCQSLLKASFAVGIESWGGSGDHGRDAAYVGMLPIPDTSHLEKKRAYTFQAKFVSNANAAGARPENDLKKAVRAELLRITGTPDCYVLITNCPVPTKLREEVTKIVRSKLGTSDIVVWGEKDVADLLDAAPILRTAFPQLLGLRDLQFLVLDAMKKPHQERAKRFIERALDDAKTFVPTDAYWKTLQFLRDHKMAVLAGPPEMGKTTAALIVGLAKAADGWQCFECRNPDDFFLLHDATVRQLFVADDAFGTTEYVPRLAEDWAAALDPILRSLDNNHWFIWTSRTAPLERALSKMNLQGIAERFPNPAALTINSAQLSITEKALMLYRHTRAAELPETAKSIVKKHAAAIVSNPHFTPKRVQRFVSEWLPSVSGEQAPEALKAAIDLQIRTPTNNMKKSLDALPDSHKRLLLAVLDCDEAGVGARYATLNVGESAIALEQIVEELQGHFLANTDRPLKDVLRERGQGGLVWTHPSWRDLVIEYLAAAPEERRRFLGSCGIAGLELALSTAGGAAGERVQPLLVDDEDWNVLGARVPVLAELMLDGELGGAMATLSEAIAMSVESSREEQLSGWATSLLRVARGRWGHVSARLVLELKQYYALSELVKPLPPGPDASATWTALVSRVRMELKEPDWYSDLPDTNSWLDLIRLLQLNEPRLLRQVGFPDDYTGLIQRIFDVTQDYFGHYSHPDTHEEYKDELDQFHVLGTTCFALSKLGLDGMSQMAESLWRRAERKSQELDMQRAERVAGNDLPPPEATPPEKPNELIPTERLFSDL